MKTQSSQSLELDKEKELKPPLLRNKERPSSNVHMQNPKPQKDRTSELQAQPLTVLNGLLYYQTVLNGLVQVWFPVLHGLVQVALRLQLRSLAPLIFSSAATPGAI